MADIDFGAVIRQGISGFTTGLSIGRQQRDKENEEVLRALQKKQQELAERKAAAQRQRAAINLLMKVGSMPSNTPQTQERRRFVTGLAAKELGIDTNTEHGKGFVQTRFVLWVSFNHNPQDHEHCACCKPTLMAFLMFEVLERIERPIESWIQRIYCALFKIRFLQGHCDELLVLIIVGWITHPGDKADRGIGR